MNIGDIMNTTKTKSYELITILEKMTIKDRLKNQLLFMYKYEIYSHKMKRKINNKKTTDQEKIDILSELCKEYIQLTMPKNNYMIKSASDFSLYIGPSYINYFKDNDINKEVFLQSNGELKIIYYFADNKDLKIDTYFDKNNIINSYIDTSSFRENTRGFNVTLQNLKIPEINEAFNSILNLLFSDILYIWIELYNIYYKRSIRKENK